MVDLLGRCLSIYSTKMYEGKDKPPRQEIATFLNTLKRDAPAKDFAKRSNTPRVIW